MKDYNITKLVTLTVRISEPQQYYSWTLETKSWLEGCRTLQYFQVVSFSGNVPNNQPPALLLKVVSSLFISRDPAWICWLEIFSGFFAGALFQPPKIWIPVRPWWWSPDVVSEPSFGQPPDLVDLCCFLEAKREGLEVVGVGSEANGWSTRSRALLGCRSEGKTRGNWEESQSYSWSIIKLAQLHHET